MNIRSAGLVRLRLAHPRLAHPRLAYPRLAQLRGQGGHRGVGRDLGGEGVGVSAIVDIKI